MTENIAPEDKTGLTIFSRNNRKAHYEMKKYVKKCPFAPPNGHLSVKSEPLFPKKILYLRHERNIGNHAKDRTRPDYHRGGGTHVRCYLRISIYFWQRYTSYH